MTRTLLPPITQSNILRAGKCDATQNYVLVIHGGAAPMNHEIATPEKRAKYRATLNRALLAGYEVLKHGGEAMDATVAAVMVLEDCPLFNAGKGSVFNADGKNELDASLMLSKPPATHPTIPATRRGSSATLLTRTKNPSHLVRALYLAPSLAPHPILYGVHAEAIGAEHLGIQTVDPSYFWTEARWKEHETNRGLAMEPLWPPRAPDFKEALETSSQDDLKFEPIDMMPTGTVGAVALDVRGCIATVMSTAGWTNKPPGRVGDSAVMGSGFWAEEWQHDETMYGVGISSTGNGDYFIRRNAASTIARRMQYLGESVTEATQHVIDVLFKDSGTGGLIAVDRQGNVALPFHEDGMYRGVIRADGVPYTAVLFDEELTQF